MKITIVGAGAIGGITGAFLIKNGHDVTFIEQQPEHVQAMRENGLKISGAADFRVYPRVLTPDEVNEPLETVFLAVKSPHTKKAMTSIVKHLTPNGYVLSLQNGVQEYIIADLVTPERTIGAFLTFGGHYVQPGEIAFGGNGSFFIGELDGSISSRLENLKKVLSSLQPTTITDNIFGYLWGKTAIASFYFCTALVNADVPDIIDQEKYRKVFEKLVAEVAAVGEAEGVACEVIDGFDPKLFVEQDPPPSEVKACWEAQKKYWAGNTQKRTGVWRDLAIHHRPTEANGILMPVIQQAKKKLIPVPRLERLVQLIKEAELQERELSWENLDVLCKLNENLEQH